MSEKQCRFDTEEHPTLTCEGHMFQSMWQCVTALSVTSEVPKSEVDTVHAEKHIISLHCACKPRAVTIPACVILAANDVKLMM
jgi:hypothetical protein